MVLIGSVLVFICSVYAVVIVPATTMGDQPSAAWRSLSADELAGRQIYIANGCTYCHTQAVRVQDWDLGMERASQAGDYKDLSPHLLGTTRTGPDLAQDGGEHPDAWHFAHFTDPRFTRPQSLMPRFAYLTPDQTRKLIAYVQSLGDRDADQRVARQKEWGAKALAAYRSGADANVKWLHSQIPAGWRPLPNPYPATAASLARGEKIYQDFCIGCHGPVGDGQGPAAPYVARGLAAGLAGAAPTQVPDGKGNADFISPPPLNFATVSRNLVDGQYIGGILYYQIMNGITGTAMPYFKHELESAKIWDVSNFVAVNFIGADDSDTEPAGIDAAYEPPRNEKPKSGRWSDYGKVDAP